MNLAALQSRPLGKISEIYGKIGMLNDCKTKIDVKDWIEYQMIDDDGQSINSPKRIALQNLTPQDEFMENGHTVDVNEI